MTPIGGEGETEGSIVASFDGYASQMMDWILKVRDVLMASFWRALLS